MVSDVNPEQEIWELPQVLDPTCYYHPVELFADREIESPDGKKETVPLRDEEIPVIMARYAVAKALFPSSLKQKTLIKVARGEGARESFMSDIRKIQHSTYKGYEGMHRGDVELVADGYGVYEILFPLKEDLVLKEAEHVKKQFAVDA